jgi:ATP-dependent Clp protease ATP-binding subunit ClpC
MASYRFPILLWQDLQGGYTATLVEEILPNATAVGETAAEAVERLREYLRWLYRKHPYGPEPDFADPVLSYARVEVRPEYRTEKKTYPVEETFALRVVCVDGKDAAGMRHCAMPTLGLRFAYSETGTRKQLVAHYVQGALSGKTPRELSRFLPPPHAALDDVVVFVPGAASSRRVREAGPKLRVLPAIADPIAGREFRRQLSRPWERDTEVAGLVVTFQREPASVILLGESGVGKTAVLAEAARKAEREGTIASGPQTAAVAGDGEGEAERGAGSKPPRVPRFWLTSAARLIAGMKYLGEWQVRLEEVISELSEVQGVLCVESLLDLVKTGGLGAGDSLAAFLMPYLQRRELRLVAEATPPELDACRRLLPGLADLFQVHALRPFTRPQALSALGHVADTLGQNLKLGVERGAVEQTYRLFARFMAYHGFPGRATAFFHAVFGAAHRRKPPSPAVTPRDVLERFIRQTGLPELVLRDDLALEHERVAAALRAQVIGQDRACDAAARVITTFKAGLNDPGRPVGVLLFAGPTGVGKTELARAMSRFLFGHGEQADRLVRLDMSEYAGFGAAERLLGDGRGGPSDLVQRLRRQPFTVVLFDEIEKAAAEVFDVLLGVLDEGRLTDRYGRLTTFRSAVIVMTSNLGAQAGEPFGLGTRGAAREGQARAAYTSAVESFFRPEFFNRIDAVVTFDPLGASTVRAIATKELTELSKREGLARANLRLTWTDAVVTLLAQAGFDPRYGARPLQRAMETLVVTPLARFLIDHPALREAEILADLGERGEVCFMA